MIDDELTDADLMYIDDTPDYWEMTDVDRLRQLIDNAYRLIGEMEDEKEEMAEENQALQNRNKKLLDEIARLKEQLIDKIVKEAK